MLGGKPAERAKEVDEGNRTEHKSKLWLQQMKLLCKEDNQHSGNTNRDLPIANGLPLEGEWSVYASGETTNSNGDTDASSTATEHVNGPNESRETKDAMENESEGCEGGMDEQASVDEVDGGIGQEVEPTDVPIELETLIVMLIKLEDLGDSEIPCVYLGGTSWCASDTNSPGCRMDVSMGQADGSGVQMDAPSMSNRAEMDGISYRDNAGTHLRVGDAKHLVYEMDGARTHMGTLTGQTDAPSIEMNMNKPANAPDIVSIPRKKAKPPDLPS